MSLKFSDGMEFDLSGNPHLEYRSDGWYIVGGGCLCPVKSEAEGITLLAERMKRDQRSQDLTEAYNADHSEDN